MRSFQGSRSSSVGSLAEIGPIAVIEDVTISSNLVEFRLPDLVERREDLPALFEAFVRNASRNLNIDAPDIPEKALAEIMTRSWAGNLPELRRYASAFAMGEHVHNDNSGQTLAEQMDAFERLVITETLRRTGGSATKSAEALGLPRNTFYDRLARYGLSPKDFRS